MAYKISEQQINPKVLSVANSCNYKIIKIPKIPGPRANSWDAKAPGWGQILVQVPGGSSNKKLEHSFDAYLIL